MATRFTLTAKKNPDIFTDKVSVGDVGLYYIDLRPWEADNATVTGVTWTVRDGNVSISNRSLSGGVAHAHLTFTGVGRSVIEIEVSTATAKKIISLIIEVRDSASPYITDPYYY